MLTKLAATLLPRPIRFLAVGLSGVAVNTAVLLALVQIVGLPLWAAAALSIETSIWNNFLLNDAWTFGQGVKLRPWRTRALTFHLVAALAAGINLGLLVTLVSVAGMHFLPANLAAIAVASTVNYSISAVWTWRPRPFLGRSRSSAAPSAEGLGRNVVIVPTFNEAGNIGSLVSRILELEGDYHVLVVDDSSLDGTGEIVARIARTEPRVHLVQRPAKQGLGTAYVAGFRRALSLGADAVFQMDADFSHDPADLPRLARALSRVDVAIGSRYVRGGRTVGWPLGRRLFSGAANLACHLLLGIPIRDVTGGFKGWRRGVLEAIDLDSIGSAGFAFQIEMNYLVWQAGFASAEVPITFVDREFGNSKRSLGIALEMLRLVLRLSLNPPQLPILSDVRVEAGLVESARVSNAEIAD